MRNEKEERPKVVRFKKSDEIRTVFIHCPRCGFDMEQRFVVERQPVVRCKDCRYHSIPVIPYLQGKEVWCNRIKKHYPVDWFCADGEKK